MDDRMDHVLGRLQERTPNQKDQNRTPGRRFNHNYAHHIQGDRTARSLAEYTIAPTHPKEGDDRYPTDSTQMELETTISRRNSKTNPKY